ncbi:hypothetical protein G6F59_015613 [Rhizopus arrhizus]|nr:hypothetical protein G6F59_015613 [Rhizopus arrhizus]
MLSSPKQGMSANDTAKALADRYLQATFPPNTRYDVNKLIPLLRDGDPSRQLAPLNSWNVPGGLPYACGLLNLVTCHKAGPGWDAFKVTVTGQGLGVLDGLLGSLVGGLLINRCDSLLGNLIDYNGCVRNNLASYIQTAPAGFLDGAGGTGGSNPDGSVSCSGLLRTLLKPILPALRPVLNSVGTLLTNLLASVLGLELGRTDVNVQSIQCSAAQLVY